MVGGTGLKGFYKSKAPNATEWSNFCLSDFSTLEVAVVCQTLGYKYVPLVVSESN